MQIKLDRTASLSVVFLLVPMLAFSLDIDAARTLSSRTEGGEGLGAEARLNLNPSASLGSTQLNLGPVAPAALSGDVAADSPLSLSVVEAAAPIGTRPTPTASGTIASQASSAGNGDRIRHAGPSMTRRGLLGLAAGTAGTLAFLKSSIAKPATELFDGLNCGYPPFTLPDFNAVNQANPSSIEQRGTVRVPLDYNNPKSSPKIDIFYRLVNWSDTSKPILVFVNGGPAQSSEQYVPLNRSTDIMQYLDARFRIVLIDQRFTDGYSAPLKMDAPDIQRSALPLARFGNSYHHARDTSEVIKGLIAKGLMKEGQFYMLSHSYGGQIMFQYLAHDFFGAKPAGIVMADPGISFDKNGRVANAIDVSMNRKRVQYQDNVEALTDPALQQEVIALRNRLAQNSAQTFPDQGVNALGATALNPQFVDAYWKFWQRTDNPTFLANLKTWLDTQLKAPIATAAANIASTALIGTRYSFILPVLSSVDLFVGNDGGLSQAHRVAITDRLLAKQGIVFVPWMLTDEGTQWLKPDTFFGGKYADFFNSLDLVAEIMGTQLVPNFWAVRRNFNQVPVLYLMGNLDPYFGLIDHVAQFAALRAGGIHELTKVFENGGHMAAFMTDEVAAYILSWLNTWAPLQKA